MERMRKRALAGLTLFLFACGGGKPLDPRFSPREPGCDVKVFEELPSMKLHNIGAVNARCDESISEADCMRQLKDEACKLGADVLWGVPPKPEHINGKMHWSGRAAHSR